jgi:hypothetical protein
MILRLENRAISAIGNFDKTGCGSSTTQQIEIIIGPEKCS